MGDQYNQHEKKSDESSAAIPAAAAEVDSGDRGLFDFMGKKTEEEKKNKCEGEVAASQFDEKVKVSGEEKKTHETLLHKFQRSDCATSSSDEEEIGEDGEKKKKKKEKKKDTNVPIEKLDEAQEGEEKKGLLDKIKEKLPGGKKPEDVASPPPTPAAPVECDASAPVDEEKEKKGFLDKIKEKIPGHSKGDDQKEKEKEKEGACN